MSRAAAMLVAWSACLTACGPPDSAPPGVPRQSSAALALDAWPTEPAAILKRCAREPFPELQTICRVQAAALLARDGQSTRAGGVCDQVPDGTWRDECHFRIGEELAAAGQAAVAAAWCAQAGWFARRCITHAAWRLKLPPTVSPEDSTEDLQADAHRLLAAVSAGLALHEDPGVLGEGRDAFKAAWGRALYRGRGVANPRAAHMEGELGPSLRTGWATEAVRLLAMTQLPPDARTHLLRAWSNNTPIQGPGAAPTPAEELRPERYAPLQIGPHDQGLPHLPLYGGGLRLVGETPEEDAEIAILEALYGCPRTGPDVFLPAIEDPRPRVRWTAERLSKLAAARRQAPARSAP